MRLFVAVTPPPEVRQRAVREARFLPWKGRVRWLPPENVHLTLKFLGETAESGVEKICAALEAVCRRHRPFDLALEGVGAFPSTRRARVVWVGVGEGAEGVSALAGDVEDALEELGFGRERRPFRAHATVGRARDVSLEVSGREDAVGPFGFRAGEVDLVRSRLSREGAAYSIVASFPLGG